MARSHPVSTIVEKATGKGCLRLGSTLLVVSHLRIQLGLDLIE